MAEEMNTYGYIPSTKSTLDLKPTVDPELKTLIADVFFAVVVILLILYIFKLIYFIVIFFRIILTDHSIDDQLPTPYNACCEIFSTIMMIVVCICAIYGIVSENQTLSMTLIFTIVMMFAVCVDFCTVVILCNLEYHSPHNLIVGTVSMVILVIQSLAMTIGCLFTYYLIKEMINKNPNARIQFWPFT